jgi:hypothetical protein
MDNVLDYLSYVLIIAVLVGIIFLFRKMENRDKNKYKKAAYNLLDDASPSPKELKDIMRLLNLYRGRFRKDKEFTLLIKRLSDKLDDIQKIT